MPLIGQPLRWNSSLVRGLLERELQQEEKNGSRRLFSRGFGSEWKELERLLAESSLANHAGEAALGDGRGEVFQGTLSSGQSVIIRKCLRGGVMADIGIQALFLSPPAEIMPRPLAEVCALQYLRAQGIRVATPVCGEVRWHFHGRAYSGSVVTEEIRHAENLLLTAKLQRLEDESLIRGTAQAAGREVSRVIAAGIFHPDLHPGNVLFQRAERNVFLIDFDKVSELHPSEHEAARERLLERWSRSSRKHGLGNLLDEPFREGLNAVAKELA